MSRDILFEVKGLVPSTVYFKLQDDLRITEDMDTEIDTASVNYGYYAILAEKADTRHSKVKFAFEAWQAETEALAMRQRQAEEQKAYTEAQMKAHVRSQPKYRGYQMKLIELDEQRRILKVISRAFEMKKDLVQSKAANRRSEIRTPSAK